VGRGGTENEGKTLPLDKILNMPLLAFPLYVTSRVFRGTLKTRDWKTRDQITEVENAGLENPGACYKGWKTRPINVHISLIFDPLQALGYGVPFPGLCAVMNTTLTTVRELHCICRMQRFDRRRVVRHAPNERQTVARTYRISITTSWLHIPVEYSHIRR